ncbi:AraC family transcriptional regulator [Azospirillum griseum]|uniref:AraC family transcriptional regulator n=2 Tax=Azospirillum griseum TaxID=2496639 RepID=A0A3S0K3B2_9PROT|nr:AraC family transcriptional regulator [Azospirillum griseum]RTR18616.1 AraC family transcriptional regulator [Azospirillum griseum]
MAPPVPPPPPQRGAVIRASALAPLFEHLAQSGGDVAHFLTKHGLTRAILSDPYSVVPLAHYIRLFESAAHGLNEPNLGVRLGLKLRPADMGPMGVLFSLSPTLKVGFERLSRNVKALQGGTQSSLFEMGEDLVWSYRITDLTLWPRRQDAEFTMVSNCQLVRSCFASDWRPVEVHFEHGEEGDTSLLQRVFRAPVLFRQSGNRFVMRRTDSERVFRTEDRGLTTILEHHIADLIGEANEDDTITDRVRALIGLYLGQKPVTLPVLARDLRMSPRNLQRRLTEEGTSLRELLAHHRQQMAKVYLSQKGARVTDVANALGYADETAFWRAFRNWTGEEPSAFRRHAALIGDHKPDTPDDPPTAAE